jgi:hypothetical protein
MARQIITVPISLMRTIRVDWDIDWRNRSAGAVNSGLNQIVSAGIPRFIGSPTLRLHGDAIGQWRALRDAAQGQRHVYRVPMMDPTAYDYGRRLPRTVSWREGPVFAEGPGFALEPIYRSPSGAEVGGTEIVIRDAGAPLTLKAGQILSFDDWPFRIISKISNGDGDWSCQVAPAIRRKIPANAIIQAIGTGLFQSSDAAAGRVAIGMTPVAEPSLQLLEWINR